MNILLTGANGFVGNYFQKKYVQRYNIQGFSFVQDNFESLHLEGINAVIHLSALVHQMGGASIEVYEKINVQQTVDLARKAKEIGVGHFILMSTIKVYGEETNFPYSEISQCAPQDEYAKSKFKAEMELQKLASEDFIVSVIRTPIVYGYGVKANIKSLINLIQKTPILPLAGIKNKRSFVYVGNLCAMIEKIIETKKSGIFLACDDESLSTTKLIKLIAHSMGKKIQLIQLPFFSKLLKCLRPSIYKRLYENLEVDNTQTKKVLEFKNPYTVAEGIRFMMQGDER